MPRVLKYFAITFAVIIGLGLAAFGYAWGDAAAAIAVAVLISILGLRLGKSTIETLVDRAPEGASEKAEEAIRAIPGVVDVERLRVRMVGARHFVDATVHVPRTYPIDRIDGIKRKDVLAWMLRMDKNIAATQTWLGTEKPM